MSLFFNLKSESSQIQRIGGKIWNSEPSQMMVHRSSLWQSGLAFASLGTRQFLPHHWGMSFVVTDDQLWKVQRLDGSYHFGIVKRCWVFLIKIESIFFFSAFTSSAGLGSLPTLRWAKKEYENLLVLWIVRVQVPLSPKKNLS